MLRPDEENAWNGFKAAAPQFAGELLASDGDGPDPPDVMCVGKSGKRIGVELTKWLEHSQITNAKGREFFENSFLKIIDSAREPRPDRIGWVVLNPKSERVKPGHEAQFRSELFALLGKENATPDPPLDEQGPPLPVPIWNSPQGAPVADFIGFPTLEVYLHDVWIFPRKRLDIPDGFEWIMFRPAGGAYIPDWMVQAAIDRIRAKIQKYQHAKIRTDHSLREFDLVCFYCDEALLHNTPINGIDFGFPQLALKVRKALEHEPKVFDRIFLFNPNEKEQVIQV
jgi:hypothetical protein